MPDVIVIGGGVIGLTTACELADRGQRVIVLDRQQPGREASWAGAGILPPGIPGDPKSPLANLSRATHALWPELSDQLRHETAIDNGFRQCGGICFSPDLNEAALQADIDRWQIAGVSVEPLSSARQQALEPGIGPSAGPGYRLPETWQVRNPRHMKALLAACSYRDIEIRPGQTVVRFERQGERITDVQTTSDRFQGDAVLLTAGAWSKHLMEGVEGARIVEPVRGQMLLLSTRVPLVTHVIECGPRYIVPRPDGRTLVGSTEEWVGFEKRNTPTGMRGLMDFAIRMVPGLGEARFEQAWSGLRPHAVDGLPLIGQVPTARNLFVATGHFRAGLHLSPITARLTAQLMTGEATDLDLAPFSPVL